MRKIKRPILTKFQTMRRNYGRHLVEKKFAQREKEREERWAKSDAKYREFLEKWKYIEKQHS